MLARQSYGQVKFNHNYRVIEESGDWMKVSVKGKRVYVPREVFYGNLEAPKHVEKSED